MPSTKTKDGVEVEDYGLSEVYCPEDPDVDIVIVHGLNGHPAKTWTAENDVFWPSTLLPASMGSVKARIMVYGYNADVYAFRGSATTDKIHEHAQTLIGSLQADRFNCEATQRPILWVGHSLGGILIKRALNYSAGLTNRMTEDQRDIYISTYGIIFLGTPHNGADPAKWGKILESIGHAVFSKIGVMDTSGNLIDTLKKDSETLQNINLEFMNHLEKFALYLFHEAKPTPGIGFIVDQTSAGTILPGCQYGGIEATHTGMCKFSAKNAPGYSVVSSNLKRYALLAPDVITRVRWPQEIEDRRRRRFARAREDFPDSVNEDSHAMTKSNSQSQNGTPKTTGTATGTQNTPNLSKSSLALFEHPTENLTVTNAQTVGTIDPTTAVPHNPPFVKPAGFRENSEFFGMERELIELDEKVFDPGVRAKGTACVLLWCLPGGGKSYIAREYVYKNRGKFPGGIFWVQAKSKSEIWQGFWDIAEKIALKDLKDPRTLQFEDEKAAFVEAIKNWFQKRHGWLLVFDGITVDNDDEVSDLQKFVPDSIDSAIIITSVNRFLAKKQRLLYPAAVHVEPLREEEALAMLFKELGIKYPSDAEKAKAVKIVQKLECLPLAIHAVGRHINQTGEQLVRYHIRDEPSESKVRDTYTDIMEDLDRFHHQEARNLINILSFFGQHIPFEMVQLGIEALKNTPVKVKEKRDPTSLPNINTTISTLRQYALMDRNDIPEVIQASGPDSQEKLGDTIDMLKIHSVVQSVFVDTLRVDGQLPAWLEYATKVFCKSYDKADNRIKAKTSAGLVSDYRHYEVHGNRLMEHILRYKKLGGDGRLGSRQRVLEGKLNMIQDEIEKRTPNSSQEAVGVHTSIFDRQSSTSSTGPETPTRTLSIISNRQILEQDKPNLESPVSINSSTTYPEIMNHSPGLQPLPFDLAEDGYTTDDERQGQDFRKDITMSDARPMMPTPIHHDVPRQDSMQLLTQRPRDDHPEIHRTIIALQEKKQREKMLQRLIRPGRTVDELAQVTSVVAKGDITTRPTSSGKITAISEAEASLTSARRGSSPSRGGGLKSDRRRSSNSRDSIKLKIQALAAKMGGYDMPEAISPTESTGSQGSLPFNRDPSNSIHGPSPLREPSPHSTSPTTTGRPRATSTKENIRPSSLQSSPALKHSQPVRTSTSDLPALALAPPNSDSAHSSKPPRITGPNPLPLPYEQIDAPKIRNQSPDPASSKLKYAISSEKLSKPYPDDAPTHRTGYTSDMSREPSTQSVHTVAGSEPGRYSTALSPFLFATDPPIETEATARNSPKSKAQRILEMPHSPLAAPTSHNHHVHEWARSQASVHNELEDVPMGRTDSAPGFQTEDGYVEFGEPHPLSPVEYSSKEHTDRELQTLIERRELESKFRNGEFRQPPFGSAPYPKRDGMPAAPVDLSTGALRGRGRRRGYTVEEVLEGDDAFHVGLGMSGVPVEPGSSSVADVRVENKKSMS